MTSVQGHWPHKNLQKFNAKVYLKRLKSEKIQNLEAKNQLFFE